LIEFFSIKKYPVVIKKRGKNKPDKFKNQMERKRTKTNERKQKTEGKQMNKQRIIKTGGKNIESG